MPARIPLAPIHTTPLSSPRPRVVGLPLLLLLACVALGWNLGGHHLLDPDEGRNAEVAREMAHTNNYLVPHLDGLPYLDKPVVYFAAAAGVMEIMGPSESAARLPAYLATLFTIALLVAFAERRWGSGDYGDTGWLAGIAYATMVLPLAYARTAIFDSTLTLCTTAAILWFFEERPVAAWAAMGAGALVKGPIALALPLLVSVAYARARGAPLRPLFPPRGLAVFAGVALSWFVAVSVLHPEFPYYVFVRETLQRMATGSFHRTAPPWYYLPIMPIAAFPWIVPALARVGSWRSGWRARLAAELREPLLLASWVIVPFVLFTLNQSKLPQYLLPLMPAFALAATRNIARGGVATGARTYAGVAAVVAAALATLTYWMPPPSPLTPAEKAAIPSTALALAVVAFGSAVLVVVGAFGRRPRIAVLGYAVVGIAIPFAGARLLAAAGDDRSAAAIARATAAALEPTGGTGAVLGVHAYPPSLPFYLGRPIAVATATGAELTSNYIADYQDRYRDVTGSPLLPEGYWREALARCPVPTVFVAQAGNREIRAALAALPLVAADGRYAVYGPCKPPSSPPPPHPPQPPPRHRGRRVR